MTQVQMLSLYDYLGHAAGQTLGKRVALAAVEAQCKIEQRFVATKSYTGPVLLYPKQFLEQYFKDQA